MGFLSFPTPRKASVPTSRTTEPDISATALHHQLLSWLKPLGCYGDGGAIFTDDDAFADLLRSLRFHGKGADKYDNVRVGFNSRLDTIQAAILIEKLAILDEEIGRATWSPSAIRWRWPIWPRCPP